jgi:hypothetical protein
MEEFMARALATIQIVKNIENISGKDKIGLATFWGVGFAVIVNKAEVKPDDQVVYFEVDSLLPLEPWCEFLRARCFNEKFGGFRIRAMRMGGVFSEGLALPVGMFPGFEGLRDGTDVTDKLKVRKYDPEAAEEAALEAKKKRSAFVRFLMSFWFVRVVHRWLFGAKPKMVFPSFLSKTDEVRVQNIGYVFESFQGLDVVVTEKCEGQSVSYALHKKKFIVCSRNLQLAKDDSKYWQVAVAFDVEAKLRQAVKDYGHDIAIQCENCGPGIQSNIYKLDRVTPFVFNVFNIRDRRYFTHSEVAAFCLKYGFSTVPLVDCRKFDWQSMDELTAYANGESKICSGVIREGVVVRSLLGLSPEKNMSNMWSFKVISPNYLVKK